MRFILLPLALFFFGSSSSAETLRVLVNDTKPFFYLENGQPGGARV